ncbi:MAG TPA: 4-hydroxy-tetrahydrodipicolinate synthase [Terriglobia bacterium]|nr:4-hydroxy-tetrahydrodipicolinate synthase [Terriglobia bacterium]
MKALHDLLGRVAIPLVTPFRANEEINFEALAEIAEFVVSSGFCDSLILTATTGEFYALSDGERIRVWEEARNAVKGRVPLVAGVGAASTRATVELAQAAERLGYDVAMVVVPYYSRPTQEGLVRHFRTVAAAVSIPILIYNIPLFVGVNLEPETLEALRDVPNIRGVKDEAGLNPMQATAFALRMPPDFSIYCGDDPMVLQSLSQRAVGAVSGGAHVVGDWMKAMIAAYFEGDGAKASRIYFHLAPFFAALSGKGRINPTPLLRTAIEMFSGIPIGPPRSPQVAATPDEAEVIKQALHDVTRVPAPALDE